MPCRLTKNELKMFRGLTFCFVGDFGPPLSEPIAYLVKHINLREGKTSPHFDDTVTHLICSKNEFKKRRNTNLKRALRKRKCFILDVDWLERSMVEKKKRPENEYSFRNSYDKEKAMQETDKRKAEGIRLADAGYINTSLNRPYSDYTHFIYDISLVRGTDGERIDACLFESIYEPRLYHFCAKLHSKKGAPAKYYRLSENPGSFEQQFDAFKDFFQRKTGISWEERLIKTDSEKEYPFCYIPPSRGKPVGHLCDQFKPREESGLDYKLETFQTPEARVTLDETKTILTKDDAAEDSKLVT